MTVQDVTNFVDYTGDAIVASFAFNFRVEDTTWVDVNFNDDLSGIALNLDQDASPGGTVDYSVPPPDGQFIHIQRITPIDQQANYTRYDPFDSEANEDSLDKLTMAIQDLIQSRPQWAFVAFNGNRTLTLSDAGKLLKSTDTIPQTVTVPPNSDVPFEAGDQISFWRKGSGTLIFVGGSGVTIEVATILQAGPQHSIMTLIQDDTLDNWILAGGLAV